MGSGSVVIMESERAVTDVGKGQVLECWVKKAPDSVVVAGVDRNLVVQSIAIVALAAALADQ
jgi:hypothetical protein